MLVAVYGFALMDGATVPIRAGRLSGIGKTSKLRGIRMAKAQRIAVRDY